MKKLVLLLAVATSVAMFSCTQKAENTSAEEASAAIEEVSAAAEETSAAAEETSAAEAK